MFSMKTGQAVSHQPQVVQAQNVSGGTTVEPRRRHARPPRPLWRPGSLARARATSSGATSMRWCFDGAVQALLVRERLAACT